MRESELIWVKKKVKILERKLNGDDFKSPGGCDWHGPSKQVKVSPQRTGNFGDISQDEDSKPD